MAILLKNPEKPNKEVFRLDSHCHVWSNPRPAANVWYRDKGDRSLNFLLKSMDLAEIDAIALTRAVNDGLPERDSSQLRNLGKKWGIYQDNHMFQAVNPEGRNYTFIYAEETFTNKGHLLFVGLPNDARIQKENLNIEDALSWKSCYETALVVADPPYDRGGLGKELGHYENVRKEIDALEWNSLATTHANRKAITKAKEFNLPLIYSSDAHQPELIGKANTSFNSGNLDFRSGRDLTNTLKEEVVNKRAAAGREEQSPFSAKLRHGWNLIYDKIRDSSR
jgi:hypothetical protein